MLRSHLFLLFLLLSLIGCEKLPPKPSSDVFITYVIAKGEHFSSQSVYKFYDNITDMRFTARFDSSAIYTNTLPSRQEDMNKLYGFADDNKQHHFSSARIGWRWFGGKLELHGYVYNDSIRTSAYITSVPLKTDLNCSIQVNGSQYQFTINGTRLTMPRKAKTPAGVGYRLYPYFGGTAPAPHEIRIKIRED